ncbi:MAG: FtsQ-type POTRA domain-containing protein [Fimbriimonadaceae bacterium]|nr:FtsQ-type POTRA domain-containing protein [Alphaproteobacteria bacterium]
MPKVTGKRRTATRSFFRAHAKNRIGLKERMREFFARIGELREQPEIIAENESLSGFRTWLNKRERPAGFWPQIHTGTLPMGPAVSACAAFYVMTGAYGITIGGHLDPRVSEFVESVAQVTTLSGLTVNEIEINGLSDEFRRGEVLAAMQIGYGEPIIWLNTNAARNRIENLSWIKNATVMRLLPEKLSVTIDERVPYAIWQINGRQTIIDADGIVISDELDDRFAGLPLVVGAGANEEAREFLSDLEHWPSIRSRLLAAVRVAERRWNIRLLNDVDIRLPESNPGAALDELVALDDAYGLLARDIVAVDFRVRDRITIRLTDEAALRRDAALKEQGRNSPRPGGET